MPNGERTTFGLGYWIFSHRRQLHLALVLALAVLCLVIWGVNVFFGISYLTNRQTDTNIQKSFLETDILFDSIPVPQALHISSVQAVRRDDTHVDVVALIQNPNSIFAAHEVIGQFTVDGKKQSPITFFVNAHDTFYLPQLSIETTTPELAVTFAILSIDWFRLHGELSEEHWEVSAVEYSSLAFEEEVDLQRQVSFSVTNKSAFSFRGSHITVILLLNSQVVGLASTVTDTFPSLASKQYTFTWTEQLPLQAIPLVQIHIDRNDPNQILSPGQ